MNIRTYILSELRNCNVAQDEISAETNFILENLFNITNFYIDLELTQEHANKLKIIFEQRKQGYPIQYILNVADFMGEKFFVNESTLIPRQETEMLVLEAINHACPKILDIGTGSGCIAIMLAKKLKSEAVTAIDISPKTLDVAKINAQKHNVSIQFIQSDLFANISDKYDMIVSNPPYIPPKEKISIQKEVSFEPDIALYTKDELGIDFYEKIISNAKNFLNPNGCVIFEIGINQSALVKKIFMQYNYKEVKIIKDLSNIDRVISARI